MKKSIFISVVLGIILCLGFSSLVFSAAKEPIKIGWLCPLTGQWAEVGRDMTNGFNMYLEEIGNKIAGREIVVINEDTRGIPETAVTKLRKVATHDKVAVIGGIITAPSGLATAAAANDLEVPLLIDCAAADDNTQRLRKKWATRIGWTGSQPMFPFGEWTYKRLGYKKVVTVAVDFQFGYDTVAGFQKTFEAAGGQVIQKIWVPVSTVDFAPYIANIRRDADAVWINMVAAMSLKFPKQYTEAGLKLPLFGSGTVSDEYILPAQGDEILGFISPLHYSAALNTPANRKFQEKYQGKYKKIGSYYAGHSYESGMWLKQAIEAVNGNVEDKEGFLKAIKNVKLPDPPRGPFSMDAYGNPIQNIYIRKVEKVKGFPLDFMNSGEIKWNVVIDTIPAVSQFWKYNPEEYMKQPVYTQSYPPCNYCK
jgi:branched-chain amino acid transport system substrate-binding protein